MITLHSNPVQVTDADLDLRLATVTWPDGRVRCVSMLELRGTAGGMLEVMQVCREAEKRSKAAELAQAHCGGR